MIINPLQLADYEALVSLLSTTAAEGTSAIRSNTTITMMYEPLEEIHIQTLHRLFVSGAINNASSNAKNNLLKNPALEDLATRQEFVSKVVADSISHLNNAGCSILQISSGVNCIISQISIISGDVSSHATDATSNYTDFERKIKTFGFTSSQADILCQLCQS